MPDEISIKKQNIVDPSKIIKQGEAREDVTKHGPNPVEIRSRTIENGAQTLLDREETINYVSPSTKNTFPISINVENVDIRTFMNMLSRIINTNILVSDEVEGFVTAKLKNVPWTTVLTSILNIKRLAQHVDESANLIRIHDQQTIVDLENFERKRQADQQKSAVLAKASMPMTTKTYRLYYTKPAEIKALLDGVLESQTTEANSLSVRDTSAQITIDSRMNQLIVKAREDDLALIEKLIAKADARTKQVYIEAFIVEASEGFAEAIGTRLGFNGAQTYVDNDSGRSISGSIIGYGSNATGNLQHGTSDSSLVNLGIGNGTAGISLLGTINNVASLKLELSAMEREGLTKVISNPRIYTLDNQEAIIFQGFEVPYETVSESGTQIEFKEAGLRLAVTPSVVGDGNLLMKIQINKDTVDTSISNPPIIKSEIKTSLVTQDGAIVVIGGIYTQSTSKSKDSVPFLSNIPILGKLLSRKTENDDRQELIVFIAPRVL